MKKVILGYRFLEEGFSTLSRNYELVYPQSEYFSREELEEILPDADVLVPSFKFRTDQQIIDAGKKLKLIANFGVGYNNIDVDYATSKGITVTNTPHSVTEPTAELGFGLMLAAARRIGYYDRHLRTEQGLKWGLYDNLGLSVYGKTLGIFGMGHIGQAMARRGIASGMTIIYHNRKPLPTDIEKKYQAEFVNFDTLLSSSDFLSVNAPATDETYHIIGEQQLKKMKPSSVLLNIARGALIDEQALLVALKENIIAAAALDVYENEPRFNPEFKMLENVVLSPHAGTQTLEARLNMQREVAANIDGFFNNRPVSKVN